MHDRRILVAGMFAMTVNVGLVSTDCRSGEKNFGQDVAFLREHVDVIVLGSTTGPRVAVVPAYQGRVMTSTALGDAGLSYGWINYDQVEQGLNERAQINVFGGEERFWLGPEGGQYSIFFRAGAAFEFANWQTPPLIDADPFQVVEQDRNHVAFRHEAAVQNYSGTRFDVRIDRRVALLQRDAIDEALGFATSGLDAVGYRTTNRLTNRGARDWTRESGLLSIWLLGMYRPGPETTVVIPYREGGESDLGPVVNDDYFGKAPASRLKVEQGAVFFAADGQYRTKIGISPRRATPICGSYDAASNVLTIVKYNQPEPETAAYVNSLWELQEHPYGGDVINAYNDGPPEPGADPLGPFYELETSSPALALPSGGSGVHVQQTFHLEGSAERFDAASQALLGVTLQQIREALP